MYSVLCAVCCLLFIVFPHLFVSRCLLFVVVRWMCALVVTCSLLCVVCCVLVVVVCLW